MNMEIITQDGEVMEEGTALATASMAVQLQKAEIDQLVSTAHAFPRSLKRVQTSILNMATLDEESAEECIYALPRGGKPIRGPSIRFAEILKQSYGNCRAAARVVHVDKNEGYVEAEGVFHDLETNSASTARVRRRITDRSGRIFKDDMIIVTGNAACSIAMRNAILAGVPKPLWRKAYDMVQATITGDITTLSENREKAFKALSAFGVKPEQIYQALGTEGAEDITVDHIATLRGMYSALKNGEATVEEMFVGTLKAVSDHQQIADPLSDVPIKENPQERAAETETLAGGPNIEEQDTSAAPSADVEGDGLVDRTVTLEQSDPDQEEDLVARNLLIECASKFLEVAMSDHPPQERRGILEKGKDAWKGELPNHLDRVKTFFETADAVIKGQMQTDKARAYLAQLIGCDEAEIA